MIGVIVPDRGDRPKFLLNCKRLILNQTRQPDKLLVVGHAPLTKQPDLTGRVRMGFDKLKEQGCECVLIMENDDFYQPDYIETMVREWNNHNRPEIFGTNETLYYHIVKREYKLLSHPKRASLMNTLISCDAPVKWCADSELFLDIHLWKTLEGKTFKANFPLAIGIKHGQGLCGGKAHKSMRFDNKDNNYDYLRSLIDQESFSFYSDMAQELLLSSVVK